MHGSSALITERLTCKLADKGISVLSRNLGDRPDSLAVETGHVLYDLVMAAAVVFVMPTVLGGPHPAAAYCALVVNAIRPKTRFIGLAGSFGWGTKVKDTFEALTGGMKKAERLEPLLFEGLPTEDDLAKVDAYADLLAEKILSLGDALV
jgi:flavorubredoxin